MLSGAAVSGVVELGEPPAEVCETLPHPASSTANAAAIPSASAVAKARVIRRCR
jgi:hypothetical protein